MEKNNFENISEIIDCYFNQDFDYMYKNMDEAIEDIILNCQKANLILVINQINILFKITENEKNLGDFLYEKFHFSLTPQTPGIDLNTYTEFLEYIRDKITQHLLENGFCLDEIKEKIT
ncbi:MAG: hypothetical protein K2X69_03415 [Silvanigrellaceae bacterium]|nr:hypothetical protein [Silvanigrellaceae bacterium]